MKSKGFVIVFNSFFFDINCFLYEFSIAESIADKNYFLSVISNDGIR